MWQPVRSPKPSTTKTTNATSFATAKSLQKMQEESASEISETLTTKSKTNSFTWKENQTGTNTDLSDCRQLRLVGRMWNCCHHLSSCLRSLHLPVKADSRWSARQSAVSAASPGNDGCNDGGCNALHVAWAKPPALSGWSTCQGILRFTPANSNSNIQQSHTQSLHLLSSYCFVFFILSPTGDVSRELSSLPTVCCLVQLASVVQSIADMLQATSPLLRLKGVLSRPRSTNRFKQVPQLVWLLTFTNLDQLSILQIL